MNVIVKREMSSQAQAAKDLRQELKNAFPFVKFSVTSKSYSMGNSVDIDWTNGPTRAAVEAITDKYQYGHFNGMEDIYEYSNRRTDIPQAKFVFANRTISRDIFEEAFIWCKLRLNDFENATTFEAQFSTSNGRFEYPERYLHRYLFQMDLNRGWSEEVFSKIVFREGDKNDQ